MTQTERLLNLLKSQPGRYFSVTEIRQTIGMHLTAKQVRQTFYNARMRHSNKDHMFANNGTYAWIGVENKPVIHRPIVPETQPSTEQFDAESAFDAGMSIVPFNHIGTTSVGVLVLEDAASGEIFVARKLDYSR